MQGLITTPVHGHTALFGVYGMLGLGLMLFCRALCVPESVEERTAVVLFLGDQYRSCSDGAHQVTRPRADAGVGVRRTWHRAWPPSEFLQSPVWTNGCRIRQIGTIFAIRALTLGWLIPGLLPGTPMTRPAYVAEGEWEIRSGKEELVARRLALRCDLHG